MNQIKTGRFIAECRKKQNLTQASLAEMLGVTDRAVSKWETGKSMPDSSIMLSLCEVLDISVNELLVGGRIDMDNYNKIAEDNLLKMKKHQEEANRKLLAMETVIGCISSIAFMIMIFTAGFAVDDNIWRGVLIGAAIIIFAVGLFFAMMLEREVGYYECSCCKHKYIPKWTMHMWAMHIGRTRYMKCPRCEKWSFSKKVLLNDEESCKRS